MKNIGRGMRIGHSMRPCSSIYFLGVAIYLIFCGHACSPADPSKLDCGLFLDIYIHQKKQIRFMWQFTETIPCFIC